MANIPGIKQIGLGRWLVRVAIRSPKTGRKVEREKTVEGTLADAVAFKERLTAEIRQSSAPAPSGRLRLGDVAEQWWAGVSVRRHIEDPSQPHLLPSTAIKYRGSLDRAIKPFLGDHFVDALTSADVLAWRNTLVESGYSRAYVNTHLRVLKTLLKWASGPAIDVPEMNERPTARISRKDPNLLSAEELARFLAAVEAHWPQHHALVLVLVTTTMRIGTALALRREDLDLSTMEFVAQRRLSAGKLAPGVKRDRFGEDTPPCLPEVLAALQRLWATFTPRQLESGLMFPARDGSHHDRSVLRKCFEHARAVARIEKRLTPHGLRRTGAKLLLHAAGRSLAMEIAGHTTEVMSRHYTPSQASEKLEAARKAFRVLDGGAVEEAEQGHGERDGESTRRAPAPMSLPAGHRSPRSH